MKPSNDIRYDKFSMEEVLQLGSIADEVMDARFNTKFATNSPHPYGDNLQDSIKDASDMEDVLTTFLCSYVGGARNILEEHLFSSLDEVPEGLTHESEMVKIVAVWRLQIGK